MPHLPQEKNHVVQPIAAAGIGITLVERTSDQKDWNGLCSDAPFRAVTEKVLQTCR